MRDVTLVFPLRDHELMLGWKKRGFGQAKWNGFGGKVENESVREAAARELEEECGLITQPHELEPVGLLEFFLDEIELRVHVFLAERFEGEVRESEEMLPKWFDRDAIPFDEMWADDRHWLPHVLEGSGVFGRFTFDGERIARIELDVRGRPIEMSEMDPGRRAL